MNKIYTTALKLSNYIINKNEDKKIKNIMSVADFSRILKNEKIYNNKKILFVIPPMIVGSGGLTSILRIASRLEKKGFEINFTCYQYDDICAMEENARKNLNSYNAKFIYYKDALNGEYEYVIAGNWQAVYYSKKIKGYKIFFIQDFEPYFYNYSDNYFLAKKSYELGYHIISLGKWNIEQIKLNCEKNTIQDLKIDYIEFPFESSEYNFYKRDFKKYHKKKKIKIAVYIKREKKRIPSLIMSLLERTQKILNEKNIELEIMYFGLNSKEKVSTGYNLGKLSKEKLAKLYYECDFGMVASMTNISLVPYEMIGCGVPVIEFLEGTYESFLGKDTAILIDFNPETLVNKILFYLEEYKELEKICISAYDKIKGLSWEKSSEQFFNILSSI